MSKINDLNNLLPEDSCFEEMSYSGNVLLYCDGVEILLYHDDVEKYEYDEDGKEIELPVETILLRELNNKIEKLVKVGRALAKHPNNIERVVNGLSEKRKSLLYLYLDMIGGDGLAAKESEKLEYELDLREEEVDFLYELAAREYEARQ